MLERDIAYLPESWDKSDPCKQMNWNAFGRNDIYHNPRFDNIWWIEMNWTYNGMFAGKEPAELFTKLSNYGAMGKHIKDVVKNHDWAQYFRVGDTPSVLYMIDPNHNLDNPTKSSWAGKFARPFPAERPNYFTDFSGEVEWDYGNPCNTWENHMEVMKNAAATLLKNRESMYKSLIQKLDKIYHS